MKFVHILKVLPNGWQVPYPEEAFYSDDLLLLKDYRLNACPGNAGDEPLPYDDYLEWLQDYLYRCKIDLTDQQNWVPEKIAADPYFSCASIGWHGGFYESIISRYPCYDFPENFEETRDIDHLKGIVCDDPYAEFLTGHAYDDPPPDRLEFILREYGGLLLRKKDEEQFQKYWPGFVSLEPLHWMFGMAEDQLEPADSAWRIYLSLVLKKIKSKKARIKELDRFFNEYADIIHK
jgi:hypothetical protein